MHRLVNRAGLLLVAGLLAAGAASLRAAEPGQAPILGRWDMNVGEGSGRYPSWLEIKLSGFETLVGSYVGGGGSARPISHVLWDGHAMRFTIPKQWERGPRDLVFAGRLEGDRLVGTLTDANGREYPWTAVRAPLLKRSGEPVWGRTVRLFNGRDLSGWQPRNRAQESGWVVEEGLLRNIAHRTDLITTERWDDFKLHAEFRYPQGSNSGIYLRGRYEIQIQDDYGLEPESHLIGGIYGFLTPRINAARRAGEWQSIDATLVGRRVTEVLNGETVLDRQEIPGITGGALDSDEGASGPIMLQGDHGPIDFRNVTLTPARRARG